jgi:hypothetical protein
MSGIDKSGLSPAQADAVKTALERDPALGSELDLIVPGLDPDVRAAFWREFADLGPCSDRPAAAVLDALVRAARAPRG